jgi:hypothetical protein
MSRARQLLEEYETSFRMGSKYIEIFSNPTFSELRDIGEEVRFIADPKKKIVYAWHPDALHDDACPRLGYGSQWERKVLLPGLASQDGTQYIAHTSESLEFLNTRHEENREFAQTILKADWSWVNRYISISDLLTLLKITWEKEPVSMAQMLKNRELRQKS